MAARKKAKASKKAVKRGQRMTRAKKSPARKKTGARKAPARKSAKRASRKTAAKAAPRKAAAKKKAPARGASARAGATKNASARATKNTSTESRATAKRRAAKNNRKQIVGEGDYEASRAFLKDQSDFVKENKDRIPEMGKEARNALEGSEGPALMAAEAEARGHSKNQPEE